MNAGFALQNIEFIDVADVKGVSFIIQPHSVVFTSVLKTQLVHEFGPLRLWDNIPFYERLLNENPKGSFLISSETENTHICIRKNSIVDYDSVQCQTQNIVMFQGNELPDQTIVDIKENRAFRTLIISL